MTIDVDKPISGRASRDERRPHVEARLFDAVARLCGPGGQSFSELSVGRLAAEAGIARATFYLYFPDRTAFALRVTEHAGELLATPFAALWHAAGHDRAAMEGAMVDLVMTFRDAQGLMSAPVEAGASDPVVQARVEVQREAFVQATTLAFTAAQRKGAMRPDISPEGTAAALTMMIEHGLYRLVRGSGPKRARELASAFSQVCWHALYPDVG